MMTILVGTVTRYPLFLSLCLEVDTVFGFVAIEGAEFGTGVKGWVYRSHQSRALALVAVACGACRGGG